MKKTTNGKQKYGRVSKKFGDFIRSLRGDETLSSFAKKAKKHRSVLSRLESGTIPRKNSLEEIADNLNLDIIKRVMMFGLAGYPVQGTSYMQGAEYYVEAQRSASDIQYREENVLLRVINSSVPLEFQIESYFKHRILYFRDCYHIKFRQQDLSSYWNARKEREKKFFGSKISSRFIITDTAFNSIFSEQKVLREIIKEQIRHILRIMTKYRYCDIRLLKTTEMLSLSVAHYRIIGLEFVWLGVYAFGRIILRQVDDEIFNYYLENFEYHWEKSLSKESTIEELEKLLKC